MRLILPKDYPDLRKHAGLPMYFLAGPILGGGDWQNLMTLKLEASLAKAGFKDFIAVIPSRYEESHPLHKFKLPKGIDKFKRQIPWERHFINQASRDWSGGGCVIAWLGNQKEPREDGRSYAEDTRGEIGELRGRLMYDASIRISIGAEEGFSGLSQIECSFEEALGHRITIHRSMDEVIKDAVFYAKPQRLQI